MKVGGKLLENMKCMKGRKREGNEGGNEQMYAFVKIS
jgi:hypothetical protein